MAARNESVSAASSRESSPPKVDATNESEPLTLVPRKPDPFRKIDSFFDKADRIVDRSGQLLMKSKYLIFIFSFVVFLIYKMVEFAIFLFSHIG